MNFQRTQRKPKLEKLTRFLNSKPKNYHLQERLMKIRNNVFVAISRLVFLNFSFFSFLLKNFRGGGLMCNGASNKEDCF